MRRQFASSLRQHNLFRKAAGRQRTVRFAPALTAVPPNRKLLSRSRRVGVANMGLGRQWQKHQDNLTVDTLIVAVLMSAYIILEWRVDSWLEH